MACVDASSSKIILERPSFKDLVAAPVQGARPRPPKCTGTGRSLTVHIEEAETPQPGPSMVHSAPVRRPLPRVPTIPTPLTSIPTAPHAELPSTSRQLRPLPRPLPPPPLARPSSLGAVQDESSGDDSDDPEDTPPAPRVVALGGVRPLPMPTVKLSRSHSRHAPTRSLPILSVPDPDATPKNVLFSRSGSPPVIVPLEFFEKAPGSAFIADHLTWPIWGNQEETRRSCDSDNSDILPSLQSQCSDASELTSDDSDCEDNYPANSHPRVHIVEDDDDLDDLEEAHIDYAWVLHKNVLYRQKAEDVQYSKWVSEKRGKRITEVDYENIRNALRCL